MGSEVRQPAGWIVDLHVHIHAGYDLARFLAAAARNLERGARSLGVAPGSAGCLVVVDTARHAGFSRLARSAVRDWARAGTAEASSLVFRQPGRPPLVVISGRQVSTAEGLELLAFPGARALRDGEPIERTIAAAGDAGATVLVPWALGKWTFGRGRRVERLLRETADRPVQGLVEPPLLVGDNGNRPRWFPAPRRLRLARELGLPVLPGSDPLPLPFQSARAGRCGVFLPAEPDLERPAAQLQSLVSRLSVQPRTYWHSEPVLRFALSQVLLQLPASVRRRWETAEVA